MAAEPEDHVALSQNPHDEIIFVRLARREEPYALRNDDQVLFERKPVARVWIARTVVWFTDHMAYDSAEEAVAGAGAEKTKGFLRELLRSASGGYQEVVTHPSRAHLVESGLANMVDAGFVARVAGKDLACFSFWNSIVREADFLDRCRDILDCYELLPLEDLFSEPGN